MKTFSMKSKYLDFEYPLSFDLKARAVSSDRMDFDVTGYYKIKHRAFLSQKLLENSKDKDRLVVLVSETLIKDTEEPAYTLETTISVMSTEEYLEKLNQGEIDHEP